MNHKAGLLSLLTSPEMHSAAVAFGCALGTRGAAFVKAAMSLRSGFLSSISFRSTYTAQQGHTQKKEGDLSTCNGTVYYVGIN